MSEQATAAKPLKPVRARRELAQPRRRTQAERSEETQARILKAAASLIRKRGYARFRTADVAAEAGLSRGAQLHHFPTKDALVVATLGYVFDQARDLSRKRAAAVNRPRDLIEEVIADAREFSRSISRSRSTSCSQPRPTRRCAGRSWKSHAARGGLRKPPGPRRWWRAASSRHWLPTSSR